MVAITMYIYRCAVGFCVGLKRPSSEIERDVQVVNILLIGLDGEF